MFYFEFIVKKLAGLSFPMKCIMRLIPLITVKLIQNKTKTTKQNKANLTGETEDENISQILPQMTRK